MRRREARDYVTRAPRHASKHAAGVPSGHKLLLRMFQQETFVSSSGSLPHALLANMARGEGRESAEREAGSRRAVAAAAAAADTFSTAHLEGTGSSQSSMPRVPASLTLVTLAARSQVRFCIESRSQAERG